MNLYSVTPYYYSGVHTFHGATQRILTTLSNTQIHTVMAASSNIAIYTATIVHDRGTAVFRLMNGGEIFLNHIHSTGFPYSSSFLQLATPIEIPQFSNVEVYTVVSSDTYAFSLFFLIRSTL